MSTDTHEEVHTLPNKTVLTVVCEKLYGSSVHDGIYVPQFHYDGVHTVGPEFDVDILMAIGKNFDEEENDQFQNTFKDEEWGMKQ